MFRRLIFTLGVQNFQCRSCTNALSNADCQFGSLVTCPADQQVCLMKHRHWILFSKHAFISMYIKGVYGVKCTQRCMYS